MILNLFGFYFNPLRITYLTQQGNYVYIHFGDNHHLAISNAQIYDVASIINEAIKEFNNG
jgi:hypothetical protein